MKREYHALKELESVEGYKVLQELWMYQVSKIEEARDRAASRGQESAWRYSAGKEAGFKLAMTALARGLLDMEQKENDPQEQSGADIAEKLLDEIKNRGGEKP